MTTPVRPAHLRPGFGLLEVAISVVVLGLFAGVLFKFMADDQRISNDRGDRLDAEHVAENEIAQLQASDPFSGPASTTGYFNHFGEVVTASGDQFCTDGGSCIPARDALHYSITQTIRCDGGPIIIDNASAPPPLHGCSSARPTAEYRIAILYPSRTTASGQDSVVRTIKLGPVNRYLDSWAPATQP